MIKRIIAAILCIACVAGLFSLAGCKYERGLTEGFTHTGKEAALGKTNSSEKDTENYSYRVFYPVFENEKIDNVVAKELNAIENEFVSFADKSELDKNNRAYLTTDYSSFLAYDETDGKKEYLLSIVFDISTSFPQWEENQTSMRTLLIDLSSEKRLSLTDVFAKGYEQPLYNAVVNYFKNNRIFAAETESELFNSGIANKEKALSRFAIKEETITFYFDKGEIFPSGFECPEAVLQIADFKDYLKIVVGKLEAESTTVQPGPSSSNSNKPVDGGEKLIAFSFDDGPHKSFTDQILNVLEKNNSKATFFVLGTSARSYPDVMKRTIALGCEIANHSYNHKNLPKQSAKEIRFQVNETNKIVEDATGQKCTIFRVPYGEYRNVKETIDMPIIMWSIDTNDWRYSDTKKPNRSEAARNKDKQIVIDSIMKNVQDGDVILMHDIHQLTAEVVEVVVPELVKQGYKLVTVSELFAARGIELKNAEVYFKARKAS